MNTLTEYQGIINYIWVFTVGAMVALYILCNTVPSSIVGRYLPLHNVFDPKTNVDLNYQSIGYVMLHTSWVTKITHSTIIVEAMLWFVVFQSWHWAVPIVALSAIVLQSVLIGDLKFGICFILLGLSTYLAANYSVAYFGADQAVLAAKVLLMMGGFMRMLSHSAELVPPIMLNDSDQFVKLTAKTANLRLPLVSAIGYVAEFSSGLPNRILPVQVNYICQKILKIEPKVSQPWHQIETTANDVLKGGYAKLASLNAYYKSVMGSR
jgi:hypothetical protein